MSYEKEVSRFNPIFSSESLTGFIGHVPEREVKSKVLLQNIFGVGKSFEASFSVVGADAARSHPGLLGHQRGIEDRIMVL